MIIAGVCALAALAGAPDSGHAAPLQEDCKFLEDTFTRLTAASNARAVNPTLADVTVIQTYASLQSNVIALHGARGCDPAKLVDIVREEPIDTDATPIIAKDEPPAATPAPVALEPLNEIYRVKSNANVRAAPSTNAQIKGAIKAGGRVPVIAKVKGVNWFKVQVESDEGFVWGDLLEPVANPVSDLTQQAKSGDPDAQYQLGNQLIRTDEFEAINWWRVAAEKGHPGAQYNMGVAHYRGTAVQKDVEKAKDWWRKAAAQGHEQAQSFLTQLGG